MKKSKHYLAILCSAAMILSMAGCSGPSDASSEVGTSSSGSTSQTEKTVSSNKVETSSSKETTLSKKTITVGFSNWSKSFEFYVDLEKGMQEVADAEGVTLLVKDPNGDLAAQTKNLEDFITQGVDGIIIVPIDSKAAITEVEMVNGKNIPVVTTDIAVEGGIIASHIASDNRLGGELAADFIGKQLNGKGKIAIINNPTITSVIEREEGFTEKIKKDYPGIEIVSVQSGESKREKAMSVTENILQTNPDLKAIFSVNDMMALGALQAVQAAQKDKDIIIVGFDATEEAVKYIKEGSALRASVAQKPIELGKATMEAMLKAINGEPVEKNISVPVELVTIDNA